MARFADRRRRPFLFPPPTPTREDAGLGEAIYEAFAVEGSRAQRMVLARAGALVGLILGAGLAVSLVDASGRDDLGAAAGVVVALTATLVLARAPTPPLFVFGLLQLAAAVTLALAGAYGGDVVVLLPAMYVVLGSVTFMLRPPATALRHLALLSLSWAFVLVAGPDVSAPVTRWVAVVAATMVSGLFVRWLVERVVELATAEQAARVEAELATVELERHNSAKRAFLARMSHELRTPLNAVVGFADVLRDGLAGTLSDRQRSQVDDIAGSGRDLLGLVDELLDESTVESDRVRLRRTRIDVSDVVVGAELLLRARAREAGVDLTVLRPDGPVLVEADGLRLRQVAWNLIGNALKFTPPGGTVVVAVEAEEEVARIVVRDSGPGIAPADQQRIFERYERVDRDHDGSGIGLALCRRLVEAHGGALELDSAPGRGSTFTVTLPRTVAGDAHEIIERPEDEPSRADLDHAILVPGSVANRQVVAHVGRWFAYAAAVLLPFLALITPGPLGTRAAVIALGAVALAVAHLIRSESLTTSGVGLDVISAAGAAAIGTGVATAGAYGDLVALAFGWIVLAAGVLHHGRRIVGHVVLVLVAHATALAIAGTAQAFDHLIAVVMLALSNAVVVGWLAGRLREAMSELFASRAAAEVTRARVAAVSVHRSEFLASMSHELCTPLNAIIGFAEVLQLEANGALDERQALYVEDILASGRALLALITDLLDLAKLDAGRLAREARPTPLAGVVRGAVQDLSASAQRRGIQVALHLPEELPVAEVDPRHLGVAVRNLVANAIKFTEDGGRVEVRAHGSEKHVVITVRDTGIGILPEQTPHLFEAFHQGSRPLPPHARGGTGLGLTLANGLVALEGGRIEVQSVPDVGSTFTIVLPTVGAVPSPAMGHR